MAWGLELEDHYSSLNPSHSIILWFYDAVSKQAKKKKKSVVENKVLLVLLLLFYHAVVYSASSHTSDKEYIGKGLMLWIVTLHFIWLSCVISSEGIH